MTGDVVVLAVRVLEHGTLRDRIPVFILGSIDLALRKTWNDGRSNVSNIDNIEEDTRTHGTLCRVNICLCVRTDSMNIRSQWPLVLAVHDTMPTGAEYWPHCPLDRYHPLPPGTRGKPARKVCDGIP